MEFPTKIQLIQRKTSEQWYVNFPSALAQSMEFDKGEVWEWIVDDKNQLILRRQVPVQSPVKKKLPPRRAKGGTTTLD